MGRVTLRGRKREFWAREKSEGYAPSRFSRARNSLSLPFQTSATHATFLSVVGSAFEGVVSFLPYTFPCLTPYSGVKKLALGKLLLCSVGRYVKVSTKKRFSELMSDLEFCQVEVAVWCGCIAIVIKFNYSLFSSS